MPHKGVIPVKHSRASPLTTALIWATLFIPAAWAAVILADTYRPGINLFGLLEILETELQTPFSFSITEYTPRAIIAAAVLYCGGIAMYYAWRGNYRQGEEHGSARWGNPSVLCRKYADRRHPEQNIILTQNVRICFDGRKHRRNLNILCIGGSGSGKTRFFVKPGIMSCNCSYLICDPKGEAHRATGHLLKSRGYDVKVLNLIDMDMSDGYNPFAYIECDEDVFRLITNLIRNTTPHNSQPQDPFWEKAETALLCALMLYLHHEAPEEEQNFATVMYMVENGGASEENEDYKSPLDILFAELEETEPNHIAVSEYHVFSQAAGKTAKSILLSAAVRINVFMLDKVKRVTSRDDLDIRSLGESRRAIFAVTPDNDPTFNFIVGMLYTQAFQTLYRVADYKHGGRLPVHVRLLMDEFSNTANLSPDDFLRALATMRSREISASIVIQNLAQLKKQFGNEAWESVPGNCDTILYLGGNEAGTHKYLSESLLGKSTIDTRTHGQTKGKSGSYSQNFQNTGRELMTSDEIRRMDNGDALLFIRGEPPVTDKKYNIMKHPNLRYTEDGGAPPYIHEPEAPVFAGAFSFDPARIADYELN